MLKFVENNLRRLWKPDNNSSGEDNGQVVIVGGSTLFTGAPLMSLVAATRLVDMVFLATPEEDKNIPNKMKLFSKLRSVIWIPREDLDAYMQKSDAVLIGPGLMRFHKETSSRPASVKPEYDEVGTETKMLTKYLLQKFPDKKWVIDGGSLQTMEADWIPKGAVITPNKKEFEILFGEKFSIDNLSILAKKYQCVIVYKGSVSYVSDGVEICEIEGGNAGLTKGGSGDVLAGIIVGLMAKNDPLLAACAGSFLIKRTADELYERVGVNFNADDVGKKVFEVWRKLVN